MRVWDDSKVTMFDVETSGAKPEYALQPWRILSGDAWVTSFVSMEWVDGKAIYTGGVTHDDNLPVDEGRILCRRFMKDMLTMALDEGRTLVGWHVAFDAAVCIAYGFEKLVMQAKFLDGLLLWKHFDMEPEYEMAAHKKRPYGLKDFVTEYLPAHAGYEEEIDFHDSSPEARAKLHAYNEKDNRFTRIGARHWFKQLGPRQLKAALIEAESIPMVALANLRGLPIDTLVAHELSCKLANDAKRQAEALAEFGVTEKVVRSPVQLAKLMYEDWGLPVLKENKSKITGNTTRSTDKEVLHELAFIDPRAKQLRDYREALNNRTKFAEALVKSIAYNEDERTHPQARIFGTYTSRLTYSSGQKAKGAGKREGTVKGVNLPIGFALHQMKNDKLFRAQVIVPPGYGLLEFDASGQEYRWMAIASGDETMLSLCEPGEDPHSYMGARLGHVDYRELVRLKETDPEMQRLRKGGKFGNLSCQYRIGDKTLMVRARVQHNIPMEINEAKTTNFIYKRTYPGVPKYWDRQINETKQLGYVETFAGRRVQVVGDWGGRMAWSMGSTAINYKIQGTGGDQKYLAMAVIKDYLVSVGGYFIWDLHDGLYSFVPVQKMQQAAIDTKRLLDNLPYKKAWGFVPPIPMPWDAKMGFSWGDLKEVKF